MTEGSLVQKCTYGIENPQDKLLPPLELAPLLVSPFLGMSSESHGSSSPHASTDAAHVARSFAEVDVPL